MFVVNSDLIDTRCAQPFVFFALPKNISAKMPKRTKLRIRRGAILEALPEYMHPTNMVNNNPPNATFKTVIKYLLVVRLGKKGLKRTEQLCIMFFHLQFKNIEIYCVNCWVKVEH